VAVVDPSLVGPSIAVPPTDESHRVDWWRVAALLALVILAVAVALFSRRNHRHENPVAQRELTPRISSTRPTVVVTPRIIPLAATRPAVVAETPAIKIIPAPVPEPLKEPPHIVKVRQPRPPARPLAMEAQGVTDEQIGQAIQKGAEFLLSQFDDRQLKSIRAEPDAHEAGLNALCVYALLQSGQAIADERLNARAKLMKGLVDRMREMPIQGHPEVYARALRATALAVYNRPEDRKALRADVTWLLNATKTGAYSYGAKSDAGAGDNSNSQYGLLGVWSGAEAGIEVPGSYWAKVQKHWSDCQYASGEWGYGAARSGDGRISMTAAGIASLFVTHDYLDAPLFGVKVAREPFPPALARGLAWLEQGDNCLRGGQSQWVGYTLYGLERVGLASGFKYFGSHDWYRELAQQIVGQQNDDGSWGSGDAGRFRRNGGRRAESDELVESAYTLLFLARGRHPVMMNKLRFAGAWANRPRDVANLARYASRELERPLNWQVVPLERDWTEWNDSPILYLASHEPIKLSENDYVKLRRFVDAGGLIFTQADGGSATFTQFIEEAAQKLFPDLHWEDLPADHEIYSVNFQIDPKPKLRCLSNGARIVMLHSPEDLTQGWQLRAEKTRRNAFELGVNLFIFATGKADFRNRLSSTWLPEPRHEPSYRLRMARVKYDGRWDPEPGAVLRFTRWFEYQTGYGLNVSVVTPGELKLREHPVAYLTGTAAWKPSDAEAMALHNYVESGGVLVIEACGGAQQFGFSVTGQLLPRAFPGSALVMLSRDDPILVGKGDGMEALARPLLRPYAEQKLGKTAGRMETLSFGKGRVIYSSLDLSTALLGTNTWGIPGYRASYAQSFLKNVVLWTADGAKGE
jgi:hypothetical protein